MDGIGPMGLRESLSLRLRTAITLLCLFLVAVIVALAVTVTHTPADVRLLAAIVVAPIIVLLALCIFLCLRQNIWGFVGAAALGSAGVALRLTLSTQPDLEVGGGLPIWVTALYIGLGGLVVIWSVMSVSELRTSRGLL
jgi:4-amino-4-deoxy-L-arabinose transferase-like glycosyltransferase